MRIVVTPVVLCGISEVFKRFFRSLCINRSNYWVEKLDKEKKQTFENMVRNKTAVGGIVHNGKFVKILPLQFITAYTR